MQPGGIAGYGIPGAAAGSLIAGLPAAVPANWGFWGSLSGWAIAFLIGFVVFFFLVAAFSIWRPGI